MKTIPIRGTVVSSEDAWIYDLFGIECVNPLSIQSQIEDADGDDITFAVNSGGGDVFAGNEIYYLISQYKGNTTADITGIAASIATVICCGADNVRAVPGAQYMIHNVSGCVQGDYNAMDKASQVLINANKTISNTYRLKTGLTQKKLLDLMNEETWMDATRALELKFVDEIIGDNDGILSGKKTLYNASGTALILSDEAKEKAREMYGKSKNNPIAINKNEVDFFMQQEQLNLLKMKNVR